MSMFSDMVPISKIALELMIAHSEVSPVYCSHCLFDQEVMGLNFHGI